MTSQPEPVRRGSGWSAVSSLALVFAVALAFRLIVLPGSTPRNMDPDAAHFLNVARCFERGQGFSNVGAWPAWMKPERLPMPETFKEPGYPWLIWKTKPLAGGDPFRAGQWLSMFAGILLPLLVYALARRLTEDRAVATVAGLLAASSPLLIAQSTRVMVDSLFPAAAIAAMLLAALRPRSAGSAWALDALTGAALGAAFLLRSGGTILLLPLVVLAFTDRRPARALAGLAVTLAAAAATASPFLLRNLRLFGSPFHSDVSAYAIWDYVDQLQFNAGLSRPPAPVGFLLAHLPQVAVHWLGSLARFVLHTFPEQILGHQWGLPIAAGILLSFVRWRRHLFAYVFVGAMLGTIFAVHWDARYLTTVAALGCIYAGWGALWMVRSLGTIAFAGRPVTRALLTLLFAATLLVQMNVARQAVRRSENPEEAAAIALAPELHRRLAPEEAVMVMTTSTYAWFADRPTVHFVIGSARDFDETVQRLHVRLAVLPTDRLKEFASRFADGRLPAALQFERAEPALGVTVFRVSAPTQEPR